MGGFAEEFGDPDSFIEKRRSNSLLNQEFADCRTAYIDIISGIEGGRVGSKVNTITVERLAKTRQTVVESYNKSELKVFSQYRAVCRMKFEQQHPGKIARKGYKTSQIMTPKGCCLSPRRMSGR